MQAAAAQWLPLSGGSGGGRGAGAVPRGRGILGPDSSIGGRADGSRPLWCLLASLSLPVSGALSPTALERENARLVAGLRELECRPYSRTYSHAPPTPRVQLLIGHGGPVRPSLPPPLPGKALLVVGVFAGQSYSALHPKEGVGLEQDG